MFNGLMLTQYKEGKDHKLIQSSTTPDPRTRLINVLLLLVFCGSSSQCLEVK